MSILNLFSRDYHSLYDATLSLYDSINFFFVYQSCRHIEVQTMPGQTFIFTTKSHRDIPSGTVAFSLVQRKWAVLSLNQDIDVRPFTFDTNQHTLTNIILEVDFLQKKRYMFLLKLKET